MKHFRFYFQSLLERFEETLATLVQAEDPVPDYEGTNPDPDRGQTSPGWDRDREGQRPPPSSDIQEPEEDYSMAQSPRYRLQDVLMAARSKTSGCFGARLDRIGNSSGLGCNNRKGRRLVQNGRGIS